MASGWRSLQVIATATIGAFLAGGGLGRYIIDGIARRDDGMLYAGVLLVAVLAIGTDVLLSWLQRRLTPRGVRIATERSASRRAGAGSVARREGRHTKTVAPWARVGS